MNIKTDYTTEATKNTLACAPLDRYRLAHWLKDVVANYFSNPINIHDPRLANLLCAQDGIEPDECRALFKIGLPYSKDSRKACTTPAVMVSVGATQYMTNTLDNRVHATVGMVNAITMGKILAIKTIAASIAVITESLEGTLLMCDALENFFVMNETLLLKDYGGLSSMRVTGSSEPAQIGIGDAMNAKEIYQSVISLTLAGGMAWTTDTQGPVFRGTDADVAFR